MSTLTDAVVARVPNARLVQLTNKDSRSASTVNTTVLGIAADDAVAEFETKAGRTFDDTDAKHIRIVWTGVIAFLIAYKGQEGEVTGAEALNRYAKRCEEFRAQDVNKRVQPVGSRTLGPSPDVEADGSARRPEFDRPRFDDLDVSPPSGNAQSGA